MTNSRMCHNQTVGKMLHQLEVCIIKKLFIHLHITFTLFIKITHQSSEYIWGVELHQVEFNTAL